MRMTIMFASILAAGCIGCAAGGHQCDSGLSFAGTNAAADTLYNIPENIETRWASAENFKGQKGQAAQTKNGRKGSANFKLPAGDSKVLAEVSGSSGTVRRIWITINDRSPRMLRGIRLDMYWDGAAKPAVSVPLGDFFGQGLGQMATYESALFSSPEGNSFNCYVPMPFKTGMKIVATNESGADLRMFFYDVDYTLGDKHSVGTAYFHAYFHRENPTKLMQDYEILPRIEGRGRYLGALISVIPDKTRYRGAWWGEGELKVYLDGDQTHPTLCGTGTEDYIGTGWGMKVYSNLYQGCLLSDKPNSLFSFYRWHVRDPVYFHQDIRITMQQIGYSGGAKLTEIVNAGETLYIAGTSESFTKATAANIPADGFLFERQDDWSSCAFFYLDRPTNDLPPLESVETRTAKLGPVATKPAK